MQRPWDDHAMVEQHVTQLYTARPYRFEASRARVMLEELAAYCGIELVLLGERRRPLTVSMNFKVIGTPDQIEAFRAGAKPTLRFPLDSIPW